MFRRTTEEETKPVPVTVSANAGPPEVTGLGLNAVISGFGFGGVVIVKIAAFDVPPPGGAVKTVILALPAVAISAVVTCAVNCVLLTNVVGSELPLMRTTEACEKLVPLTVSVKPGLSVCTVVGLIVVMRGIPDGAAIVKVTAFEAPPPGEGLTTVTLGVPTVVRSLAGI